MCIIQTVQKFGESAGDALVEGFALGNSIHVPYWTLPAKMHSSYNAYAYAYAYAYVVLKLVSKLKKKKKILKKFAFANAMSTHALQSKSIF